MELAGLYFLPLGPVVELRLQQSVNAHDGVAFCSSVCCPLVWIPMSWIFFFLIAVLGIEHTKQTLYYRVTFPATPQMLGHAWLFTPGTLANDTPGAHPTSSHLSLPVKSTDVDLEWRRQMLQLFFIFFKSLIFIKEHLFIIDKKLTIKLEEPLIRWGYDDSTQMVMLS